MVNPEYWIHDDIVLKPATSMIVEMALKTRLHVFLRCRAVELPYVSENSIPKCGHLHTTKGASVPTKRGYNLANIPTRPGQPTITSILGGHRDDTWHPRCPEVYNELANRKARVLHTDGLRMTPN